jgi:hypothetical protein
MALIAQIDLWGRENVAVYAYAGWNHAQSMAAIDSLIVGSEKLTTIFGYWPSFHDAEVSELHSLAWRHSN